VGGALSNNKGINRQGGGLSAAATFTEKDKEDIKTAAILKGRLSVAVPYSSFPRCAS